MRLFGRDYEIIFSSVKRVEEELATDSDPNDPRRVFSLLRGRDYAGAVAVGRRNLHDDALAPELKELVEVGLQAAICLQSLAEARAAMETGSLVGRLSPAARRRAASGFRRAEERLLKELAQ